MNPYSALDEKHFWSPAIGKREATEIEQLWNPKRLITRHHKISAFGSCFAQYFGNALAARNYKWMQYETPPVELSTENAKKYNYGVFSARTANIYTTSLLKQWTEWSLGESKPPTEVWYKNGRYYDPFRPTIEPNGFATELEVHQSREITLEAFRKSIVESDLFVFTLGLTESWCHTDGYEYPMCPGTVAGEFDKDKHVFHNQSFDEIRRNLLRATHMMLKENSNLRFLLTVSPVPLTATMSGKHVLTATTESKSILRAVAGELSQNRFHFDYFPSYEIISSTPFKGMFFNENKRTVKSEGVDFVMNSFFGCLHEHFGNQNNTQQQKTADTNNQLASMGASAITVNRNVLNRSTMHGNDAVCEEELLEAFGPKQNNNMGKAS